MQRTVIEPTLEETVERFHTTVRAISKNALRKKVRLSDSEVHYDHITGQLLSVLTKATELYRLSDERLDEQLKEKIKRTYRFNEKLLFSYLKLLGVSKEFQYFEFTSIGGLFGDDDLKVPVIEYVEKSIREFELEQVVNERYPLV